MGKEVKEKIGTSIDIRYVGGCGVEFTDEHRAIRAYCPECQEYHIFYVKDMKVLKERD